jgi:hypothetical protein
MVRPAGASQGNLLPAEGHGSGGIVGPQPEITTGIAGQSLIEQ